jgi:hypothetical protein
MSGPGLDFLTRRRGPRSITYKPVVPPSVVQWKPESRNRAREAIYGSHPLLEHLSVAVIVDKDSTDGLPKGDSNKGQSMPDGVSAGPFPAFAQSSVQSGAEWNGIQSNVARPNSPIPPIPSSPVSKREGLLSKELIETVKDTELGNTSTESVHEWPMPFRQAPPRIPGHQSSLSERERQLKDSEQALEVSLHELRRREVELKRWAESGRSCN